MDNLVHHRSICTFPTLNNSKFSEEFVFSGILGLCAFVEAFPYDVPPFLPPILMELSTHLNDPQVINEALRSLKIEFELEFSAHSPHHQEKLTRVQKNASGQLAGD